MKRMAGFVCASCVAALAACSSTVTVLGGSGAGGTGSSSAHTTSSVSPITADVSSAQSTSFASNVASTVNGTTGPTPASATISSSTATSGSGGSPAGGYAYLQVFSYGQQKNADAAFYPGPNASSCNVLVAAGSCQAYSCSKGPQPPQIDAGQVVAATNNGKVGMSFNGNLYPAGAMPFLKVSDAITFAVQGSASVPAFGANITLPPPTTLYYPKGVGAFKSSDPLTVAWMGDQGMQIFGIQSQAPGPSTVGVSCAWPAALQKTQIPATVMGQLPKGKAYYYAYSGDSQTKMVSGGWVAEIDAYTQDPEQGYVDIQ